MDKETFVLMCNLYRDVDACEREIEDALDGQLFDSPKSFANIVYKYLGQVVDTMPIDPSLTEAVTDGVLQISCYGSTWDQEIDTETGEKKDIKITSFEQLYDYWIDFSKNF